MMCIRENVLKFGLFPAVVVLPALGSGARASDDRPNIVVIMADDLGFGDLSCYQVWIKEGNWACVPFYKTRKGATKAELYDLKKDVGQEHDVADQYPGKVKDLSEESE